MEGSDGVSVKNLIGILFRHLNQSYSEVASKSKIPCQARQEEWLSHFKLFTDTDRDSTVYGLLNQ